MDRTDGGTFGLVAETSRPLGFDASSHFDALSYHMSFSGSFDVKLVNPDSNSRFLLPEKTWWR